MTIPTVQFLIAACKNGGKGLVYFKARYIRRVLTIILEPFFCRVCPGTKSPEAEDVATIHCSGLSKCA